MFSKKQRNGFFNAIEQMELSPEDFSIESNDAIVVTHSPTGFVYQVAHLLSSGRSYLNMSYTPDNSGLVAVPNKFKSAGATESWEQAYSSFTKWLAYIKEEEYTPDLWAEATKTAQLFTSIAEPTNDKFTRTELAQVQGQLRLLQMSLSAAALPETARQKLIELTQTASIKAEGLTKKDWQNWIIGGFIGAITNLALNPTQAGEVLRLVKAAFGGLFLH